MLNALSPSGPLPQPPAQPSMGAPAQNPLQAAPPQATPPVNLPPPPPTKEQLQKGIKGTQTALAALTKIASNAQLLANPDKLQKALLSEAADVYRAYDGDADAPTVIAKAMSVLSDPRGPKLALQDMIAGCLSSLSIADQHARVNHGSRLLAPAPDAQATAPMPPDQGAQ